MFDKNSKTMKIIDFLDKVLNPKDYEIRKEQRKKERIKKFNENRKKRYKEFVKSNIERGKKYEIQIGKHFEDQGYIVKFNGIEKEKKDDSIDLIAIKKDEIIFIQCKNWKENSKYKITQEQIKAFIGDTYKFIENNPVYKDYKIKRLFIISNKILDKGAYLFIKENQHLIKYKVIPYKEDKNNNKQPKYS